TVRLIQDQMIATKNAMDLMADGVVFEYADAAAIAALGGPSSTPDFMAALKFPYAEARTVALALEWDDGNTGRVTPCVVFEPVIINGNTYKRVSIANMTRFDELKLCPGTPLIFQLRNDILGWVTRGGEDPEGAVPFPEPEGVSYTYNDEGQRV